MKKILLILSFTFITFSFTQAQEQQSKSAVSNEKDGSLGCRFQLCIVKPGSSDFCQKTVRKVFKRLARGRSLPQCKESGIPMNIKKYKPMDRVFCTNGYKLGKRRHTEKYTVNKLDGRDVVIRTYKVIVCGKSKKAFDSRGTAFTKWSWDNVYHIPYKRYVDYNIPPYSKTTLEQLDNLGIKIPTKEDFYIKRPVLNKAPSICGLRWTEECSLPLSTLKATEGGRYSHSSIAVPKPIDIDYNYFNEPATLSGIKSTKLKKQIINFLTSEEK